MFATLDTFLVSLMAVGKAGALASTGVFLHLRGFVPSPQAKEMLSRYSQQVGLPCLFFSKIVMNQKKEIASLSGPDEDNQQVRDTLGILVLGLLVAWPLYVVSWGLLVGRATAALAGLRGKTEVLSLVVATAFSNSTGLPTTLLSLMTHALPESVDPTRYLSVYLMLYPLLQWGIGGTLLGISETATTRDTAVRTSHSEGPIGDSSLPTASGILAKPTIVTKSSSLGEDEEADQEAQGNDDDLDPLLLERERHSKCSLAHSSQSPSQDCCGSDSLGSSSRGGDFWSTVQRALGQPPVKGAMVGWIVVSIPVLHNLFDGGCLQWVGEAIHTVGQAAIPINMAVLGINLSTTFCGDTKPSEEPVDAKLMSCVVMGKLILMPVIGLLSVWMLQSLMDLDPPVVAVLSLVWCTPTANTIAVMTDLSRTLDTHAKHGMARMLAFQYIAAPILLPVWVMFSLQLANTGE